MSVSGFYMLCAKRAWLATVNSQNWSIRKVLYRLLLVGVAAGGAFALGMGPLVQDKILFGVLIVGAAALLFAAEYLYRLVREPWLLASAGIQVEKASTTTLKTLFEEGSTLHAHSAGFLHGFPDRRDVTAWALKVRAELEKVAPQDAFGFHSAGKSANNGTHELHDKLQKLRLIIMREERGIEDK